MRSVSSATTIDGDEVLLQDTTPVIKVCVVIVWYNSLNMLCFIGEDVKPLNSH